MAHICLVGVDNYLMLSQQGGNRPANGEAVQQVLLARAFRDIGYDVSTIVVAPEKEIDERIDGIRVLSAFCSNAGIPVVRFLHPRVTGAFQALNKIDADIYLQSPAGFLTGLTAAFCRRKGRKFVFRVVSDADCIPGKQMIRFWRDRRLFEFGLRRANVVAVQSAHQQTLLRKYYGLESSIVGMAMEIPDEVLHQERDIDVLWVSNLNPVKRPDRVLTIARQLKDVQFTMIGGLVRGEEALFSRIEIEAKGLRNVRFMGGLPYGETNRQFARAKIFLNTSDVEGFPNTFLQAWVRKVPVVSSLDPDGIIVRQGLGRQGESDDELCRSIRDLLNDKGYRTQVGVVAQKYAMENFSAATSAQQYVDLCRL
jgi:glycosyltransferase involved in cell wall biosynthesis